jgi:tripartite-type tricarboxylate transporter receptor subunit TctC
MPSIFNRRQALRWLGASAAGFALPLPAALAQAFPNKPVRVLVGAAPGGPADFMGRTFSDAASPALGQPFVVDNKPGATGTIAAGMAAKAPADGHTLLIGAPGAIVVAPHLIAKLDYDADKDFIPITMLGAGAFVLVAHPSVPANNLAELIAHAKAKPGALNYGSTGVGNPLHLTMEMLKSAAGLDIQAVTYRGDAPANAALIAGEIQLGVMPMATTLPLVQGGQLKALAIGGATRSPAMPNVPTVGETIPAGTPREIVVKLQQETAKVLKLPDVMERLRAGGNESVGSTPEEYDRVFRADIVKFAKIIADAKIPKLD